MTDKEKICAEIERQYEILKGEYSKTKGAYVAGRMDALDYVEQFIDSLPGEPTPKGYDEAYLNECIAKASKTWKGVDVDKFMGEVRGRESDDLKEEFEKYLSENIEFDRAGSAMDKWNKGCHLNRNDLEDIAGYFAKWGAEHFRDSTKMINKSLEEAARLYAIPPYMKDIDVHYIEEYPYNPGLEAAFIAGAEWQKNRMMKDAVEGEVVKDISNKLAVTAKINLVGFKFGQKVKIIILKDDETIND